MPRRSNWPSTACSCWYATSKQAVFAPKPRYGASLAVFLSLDLPPLTALVMQCRGQNVGAPQTNEAGIEMTYSFRAAHTIRGRRPACLRHAFRQLSKSCTTLSPGSLGIRVGVVFV